MPDFYEFFAGAGMARAGLGDGWRRMFANGFDDRKSRTYERYWGTGSKTADVRTLTPADLPGVADLIWGSFPCQDLSLAGGGAGLRGERSGTFLPFWTLMESLIEQGRAPRTIVLENVCGTLTSHAGKDFAAICSSFERQGYRCGAVVIDAALFLPQSRPRLFFIGVRAGIELPASVTGRPSPRWHSRALRAPFEQLPKRVKDNWIWWAIPEPPERSQRFADLIEEEPASVEWHTAAQTRRLLSLMSEVNLAKVELAKRAGRRMVGTLYRRTRRDDNGFKVQRAEVRFDDVAGCLRTPAGGSSRQLILVVDGDSVRSRLISTRETARLMGLPDAYSLPDNYNEAYHLSGDGVAVHVVRYLAAHVLEPILGVAADDSRARDRRRFPPPQISISGLMTPSA